ncbi:MAG: VOC family protein [Spirochaetaceae bacterium]|nr:VOC family protein [Spirochaetaceae bacterium]MDT8299148.1 VOC family protein [Spirochaetaceae bacterium]
MSLVEVIGVEHFGMIVKDSELLAGWYGEVFGAKVVSRSLDERPILFIQLGGGSLMELIPGDGEPAHPSDHVHVSFSVDSLQGAVNRLKEAEIVLNRPVFEAYEGSPVAFLRDPEGHLVQLVERVSSLPQPR